MMDSLSKVFSFFSVLDLVALMLMICLWLGATIVIERGLPNRPSTHLLMASYRHRWMDQMITRQPRIFDASILGTMRQGTTFFASGCMIAIGAGVALLGQTEQLRGVASTISADLVAPDLVWDAKILLLVLLLSNAFLKFVWAHRLFGYCAVLMAATPNEIEDPQTASMAHKSATVANHAAKSFNRGMRSLYFAIASLAWFGGPVAFALATFMTAWMIYRREFASLSRATLLQD